MPASLSRRQVLAGAAAVGASTVVTSAATSVPAHAASTQFDVVVVGAGAAGMTAALAAAKRGLSCVVVEKAPTFGGSAARSGAGIWIPNNEIILAAGIPDTPEKARQYLAAVVGDIPVVRQQAYLTYGPQM